MNPEQAKQLAGPICAIIDYWHSTNDDAGKAEAREKIEQSLVEIAKAKE